MSVDLAVIGAGPAGMAAATLAAEFGLSVTVFDEQSAPGGQIYRASEVSPSKRFLGNDYARGAELVAAFRESGARHVPRATVWSLDAAREIGVSVDGRADIVGARAVIVATGAQERPMPIAGWTLPGVMTAGAAQIALKSAGLVPDGRVVLAGTGPLLWLLAKQLLDAGVEIEALLDTTPQENWRNALPHLPAFLTSSYFAKGAALQAGVRRCLRVISGIEAIEATGQHKLDRVAFRRALQPEESIEADLLLLHQGVVPNVNLAMAAGVSHTWDERMLAFVPALDPWCATPLDGIFIAGDGGGIGGARAAEERGRIAALAVLCRLGKIDRATRDRLAEPIRKALRRAERGRAFIDWLHRPAKPFRIPEGDTVVCRCEEVKASDISEALALGVSGPNQLKAFLRAGMGPCQGRFCGLTVSEMIAEARGVGPGAVGHYRLRPPIKPVTLGELAALPADDSARRAVER